MGQVIVMTKEQKAKIVQLKKELEKRKRLAQG